jgi:hypothetical protein
MDYLEKLFSKYVSTHTAHLYGEATLEGIRKQFPVWKSYYGEIHTCTIDSEKFKRKLRPIYLMKKCAQRMALLLT